jgi:hypothetical protein
VTARRRGPARQFSALDEYEGGLPSAEELLGPATASPAQALDAAREQLGLRRRMPAASPAGYPGIADLREELALDDF